MNAHVYYAVCYAWILLVTLCSLAKYSTLWEEQLTFMENQVFSRNIDKKSMIFKIMEKRRVE